jgi:hypothetical protein
MTVNHALEPHVSDMLDVRIDGNVNAVPSPPQLQAERGAGVAGEGSTQGSLPVHTDTSFWGYHSLPHAWRRRRLLAKRRAPRDRYPEIARA